MFIDTGAKMSLAQNFVDLLNQCLNSSQECIDSCQKVVDMCSGRDFEDCGKEIGILVSRATECIKFCERAKSHAQDYLKICKDSHCTELVQKFIDKSQKCVDHCNAVIMQCEQRTAFCISSTFDCLKACTELTEAIAALTGNKILIGDQ